MPIEKTCDWCGKTDWVSPQRARRGTRYYTCSKKCKAKMQGKFMKEVWANLTPEARNAWEAHLRSAWNADSRTHYTGQGLIDYHKALRPDRVKKVIEMMSAPTKAVGTKTRYANKGKANKNPRLQGDEWLPRGTCTMIAAHHEMLKNDPERLTTEFMEEMCGVDCKCKINKEENV